MEGTETTYAQKAIRKRINEKNIQIEYFQDYTEHTDYEAYSDYSENDSSCCVIEYD